MVFLVPRLFPVLSTQAAPLSQTARHPSFPDALDSFSTPSDSRIWTVMPLSRSGRVAGFTKTVRIQGDISTIGTQLAVERFGFFSLSPRIITDEHLISNYEDPHKVCVRTMNQTAGTEHLYKSKREPSRVSQPVLPFDLNLSLMTMPFFPDVRIEKIEGSLKIPGSHLIIHKARRVSDSLVRSTSSEIVLHLFKDEHKTIVGTYDPVTEHKNYYLFRV